MYKWENLYRSISARWAIPFPLYIEDSGVTAEGRGAKFPPDAAQRENRPYRQGKTRGGEKEKKKGKGEERKERKERKEERKGKEGGGKKGEKEKKEKKIKGIERERERKKVSPKKYQVNKINQNYHNTIYKI